jgi:hypothetical protein
VVVFVYIQGVHTFEVKMLIRLILTFFLFTSCSNLMDEDNECLNSGEGCISSTNSSYEKSSSSIKVADPRVIFEINVSDMDEKGIFENGAQIFPFSDIALGGSSIVTGPFDNILGDCPNDDDNCIPNWSFSKAIESEVDGNKYLNSKLIISDYTISAQDNWPQAQEGWRL